MIRLTLLSSLAVALLASPLGAQEEAVESLPSAPVSLMPAIPVADTTFDRYLLRMPPEDPRLLVDTDIAAGAQRGAIVGGAALAVVALVFCPVDVMPGLTPLMCAGAGAATGAVVGGLLGAVWAALPRYERPNDPPAATAATCGPAAGCTEPSGAGGV